MLYTSNRNQQNKSKRGSRGRNRRKDINIRKESEKKELEEDTINNLRSCNPFLQDNFNNNQISNDHQQSILKVDPSSSVLEKTSRKRKFEDIENDDYQSNIDDKKAYKTKRAKHNDTNLDSKVSYEKKGKNLLISYHLRSLIELNSKNFLMHLFKKLRWNQQSIIWIS